MFFFSFWIANHSELFEYFSLYLFSITVRGPEVSQRASRSPWCWNFSPQQRSNISTHSSVLVYYYICIPSGVLWIKCIILRLHAWKALTAEVISFPSHSPAPLYTPLFLSVWAFIFVFFISMCLIALLFICFHAFIIKCLLIYLRYYCLLCVSCSFYCCTFNRLN